MPDAKAGSEEGRTESTSVLGATEQASRSGAEERDGTEGYAVREQAGR